jgi:gliding motility-associated-like protein
VGANPNFGYQWSPGTDLSATNISQPWFVPSNSGSFNYQLVVTNNGGLAGCTDTATVAITVNDTPSVALSALPSVICQGESTVLSANASGGSGVYSYSWSSGGTGATETVSPGSSATFTVTVTDANTCGTVGSIFVQVNDTPSVAVVSNPDTICAGQSATLTATASGGAGSYSYAWGTGGTSTSELVSPLATTTFSVTVSDGNSCESIGNVTLVVNVADSIDITVPDTFVCNNGTIDISNTFGTSGIDTWTWSPAAGVSLVNDPNPVLAPAVSTTFSLTGLNSLTGCGFTDSIRVDVFELAVSYWQDSTICLGDTIQFDIQPTGGSGDYSFTWLSSSSGYISEDTVANPFVSPAVTTTYTVLIDDNQTGCSSTFTINVVVSPLNVQASPSVITINPGQRVQLEAVGAMFYAWTPDTTINCTTCPDPVVTPEMSMVYTVTGTDTTGCRGVATVSIVVDSFLVPNVFTPNGDGINDVLFFNYYGSGFYETVVFDRWGSRIYATKDKNAMWNGNTSSGAIAPEGVYYVVVRIIGDDAIPEKDKQKVFYVTLMR